MSSSREQLLYLAERFTNETGTEKLLQLARQLLDTLDRVEVDDQESVKLT